MVSNPKASRSIQFLFNGDCCVPSVQGVYSYCTFVVPALVNRYHFSKWHHDCIVKTVHTSFLLNAKTEC